MLPDAPIQPCGQGRFLRNFEVGCPRHAPIGGGSGTCGVLCEHDTNSALVLVKGGVKRQNLGRGCPVETRPLNPRNRSDIGLPTSTCKRRIDGQGSHKVRGRLRLLLRPRFATHHHCGEREEERDVPLHNTSTWQHVTRFNNSTKPRRTNNFDEQARAKYKHNLCIDKRQKDRQNSDSSFDGPFGTFF